MKWSITKSLVLDSCNNLIEELTDSVTGKPLPGYEKAVRYRNKFISCGKILSATNGYEVYHWCRRPVCPNCATYWGRKMAQNLVKACPDASKNDFRMASLTWGMASSPEGTFDLFGPNRRSLRNSVDYQRKASGLDRPGWLAFGLAGALEVDCFMGEDFKSLGPAKQEQYRELGFRPGTTGPQWIATTHALVHVGKLGEDPVRALFEKVAPVVHLQGLRENQTLLQAGEGVLGYAAKVQVETEFALGESRPWPREVITSYVAATMRCSHGRQGFRLVINPKKYRERTTARITSDEDDFMEAMPVLI